ncbi:hypothetical protein [Bounagaea algeriensis]
MSEPVRVVVVDDDPMVRRALRAGASGYLLKDAPHYRVGGSDLGAPGRSVWHDWCPLSLA